MFRIDRRFVKLGAAKLAYRARVLAKDEAKDKPSPFEEMKEEETEQEEKTSEGASEIAPEVDMESVLQDMEVRAKDKAKLYIAEAERELEARAEAVMLDARERAADIVMKAQEEALEEKKRAIEEGYAEGSREGKRVFDEKLAEQQVALDAELRRVLGEVAAERKRIASELEAGTVALSLEIVKKIWNPAQEDLEGIFVSLIRNAFRQIPTDSKFVIRVAPSEFERFFSSGAASIKLDSGVVVKASVVRDTALGEGDLIIDADDMTVNAGVNKQLEKVELAFEEIST